MSCIDLANYAACFLVVCSARGNLLSKRLFIRARKQMVEEWRLSACFLLFSFLLVCNFLQYSQYLLPEVTNTITKNSTTAFIWLRRVLINCQTLFSHPKDQCVKLRSCSISGQNKPAVLDRRRCFGLASSRTLARFVVMWKQKKKITLSENEYIWF